MAAIVFLSFTGFGMAIAAVAFLFMGPLPALVAGAGLVMSVLAILGLAAQAASEPG